MLDKNQPNWADTARGVERILFGALLGMLAGALAARFLLLAYGMVPIILGALLVIGAAGGAFVTHYANRSAESVLLSFTIWNTRLRKVSLKAMLWLLAMAALIGVLTVLTASYDILGRVAGTVVTTAIIAGILWPLSILADQRKSQAAGLLGMVSAILIYVMIIPLFWYLDRHEEEILLTSFTIGLMAPFGMFFLVLKNIPATWISARVGFGTYAAVLVTFLVAIWDSGLWWHKGIWWESGWWLAAYGVLSFASLSGMRKLTGLDWRWLGVAASFLAWVLIMMSLWGDEEPGEKLITVISSLAVVMAHASLSALVPLKPHQLWLRIGTVAAVVVAAGFFDLELLIAPERSISILGRISCAAAILASAGSLGLLIFARLNRSLGEATDLSDMTHITLICPRCGKKQAVSLGEAHCSKCGLWIRTAIE